MRSWISLFESEPRPDADGAAYFDADSLAGTRAQNPASREIVIHMSPDDFLALAKPGFDADKAANIRGIMAKGTKFSSIPFLSFEHDGHGTAKVVAHEGRHRARALQAKGVQSMPVLLQSQAGEKGQSVRWGSAAGTGFDRFKQVWPERLVSENGKTSLPFPVPDPRS